MHSIVEGTTFSQFLIMRKAHRKCMHNENSNGQNLNIKPSGMFVIKCVKLHRLPTSVMTEEAIDTTQIESRAILAKKDIACRRNLEFNGFITKDQ